MSEARQNADRLAAILGIKPISGQPEQPVFVTKGEVGDYPLMKLYAAMADYVLAHSKDARP